LDLGAKMKQPHHVFAPTLRQELDKIISEAEEANLKAVKQHTKPISLVDQYTNQISQWVETMTPLQAQRKYTLPEVISLAGLKGFFRDRASNQFTGVALRRCGFVAKRDWTNEGRNRRWWQLNIGEIK